MNPSVARRRFVALCAAGSAAGLAPAVFAANGRPAALARVILDNDFSGDPDGLFQLARHVLCRSLTMPLIVGSHLPARFSSGHDAQDAASRAHELLKLMGLGTQHKPVAGAEAPITSRSSWRPSAASQAIVREAMRDDTRDRPGQTSSLRLRNSSLNCQPSKVATIRPSSFQESSRPSTTTIGTR